MRSQSGQIYRDRKENGGHQGLRNYYLMGIEFLFGMRKKLGDQWSWCHCATVCVLYWHLKVVKVGHFMYAYLTKI
jgi:hypothetical protein